jgi:hypothetical protein
MGMYLAEIPLLAQALEGVGIPLSFTQTSRVKASWVDRRGGVRSAILVDPSYLRPPLDGDVVTLRSTPTFFFTSDDPTATFGCRLTKQGDVPSDFTGCTSPITYLTLSEDTYTLEVRAEDEAGNEDATPAERTFSVDTTSRKVTSLKATSVNSSGVPLRSTNFRATFSEFMNSTTLNNGNFLLYECPSTTATDCPTRITDTTVRGSRDRLNETLNPFGNTSSVLKANSRYKVTVTALDYAGNVLDQKPAKEGNQTKVAFFTTGSG